MHVEIKLLTILLNSDAEGACDDKAYLKEYFLYYQYNLMEDKIYHSKAIDKS